MVSPWVPLICVLERQETVGTKILNQSRSRYRPIDNVNFAIAKAYVENFPVTSTVGLRP
jgi:hypothetical protein